MLGIDNINRFILVNNVSIEHKQIDFLFYFNVLIVAISNKPGATNKI